MKTSLGTVDPIFRLFTAEAMALEHWESKQSTLLHQTSTPVLRGLSASDSIEIKVYMIFPRSRCPVAVVTVLLARKVCW